MLFRKKVKRIGTGNYVLIPKSILDYLNMEDGSKVIIKEESGKLCNSFCHEQFSFRL